jgi:thioredoxin-dependent peroxiredoxin
LRREPRSRHRSLVRSSILLFALLVAPVSCGQVRRPDGGSGLLMPRERAPAFSAPDQHGKTRTLAEFAGRPIVLFFYPKDGTPGCTKEACAFRDRWSKYEASGAVVVGVSRDSVEKHRSFAEEHKLQFPLLSDDDGTICKSYGVGSTLGMASRVTFLIDRNGVIARTFEDVSPATHADEVLAAIAALPK